MKLYAPVSYIRISSVLFEYYQTKLFNCIRQKRHGLMWENKMSKTNSLQYNPENYSTNTGEHQEI